MLEDGKFPPSSGEGQPMTSQTTQQALPTGTWSVDKIHSTVGFAVPYMAGTFQGTFSDFDARLADGVIGGTAEVASVQVKDPNLEAHLQSPEFFDAERFPQLSFEARDDQPFRRRPHDRRRADAEGPHRAGRDQGPHHRPGPGSVRRRAFRPPAGDHRRPDQVRPQLEQPAPERRPGAGQRRHDHRRPAAGEGGLTMRVLGISGSLRRDSHNTSCCVRPAGSSRSREAGSSSSMA